MPKKRKVKIIENKCSVKQSDKPYKNIIERVKVFL